VRAIATRHGSSGRPSWATEIVALIDEGRYAQAGRLVKVLAECGPDAHTARLLRHARQQIEQLSSAPGNEIGRQATARAAVHALLADAPPAPVARPAAGADPGAPLAKWPLAIRAFGPLDVWVHGRRVPPWTSRASRAMLRILAVHRGRPVHREWLMDQLWPDAPTGAASNSLNVAVHALRRALGSAHPEHARLDYVSCRDGAYELAPGLATWVDVEQFDRHRAQGRAARRTGDKALAAAHFQAATAIYRGPLFEDDGADWHLERRLALQESCCDMLEALAELRLDLGHVEGAEQACRRLLAIDPCWEGGHRQLMRTLAERGEYGRAVRQYGRCATVLARELDVTPDGRTKALYEAVKARLSADRDPSVAHVPGDHPDVRRKPTMVLLRRHPGRHTTTEGKTMPQANDAEITDVYSASLDLDVEDNEPNTPAPGVTPPNTTFDVQLEMVAGNAIGNSAANYTLTITCIDETVGAPNAQLSVGPLNQEFKAADGWTLSGPAGNFFNKQRFTKTVPPAVQGHVFRYIATLVSANNDIVSFRESNRFILI